MAESPTRLLSFYVPAVVEPGLSKTNILTLIFYVTPENHPRAQRCRCEWRVARDSRYQQARGPLHPAAEARSGSGIKPGGFLDTGRPLGRPGPRCALSVPFWGQWAWPFRLESALVRVHGPMGRFACGLSGNIEAPGGPTRRIRCFQS